MKKYDIPQIKMMHFSDVIEVTSSVMPAYIPEVEQLTLGLTQEQFQQRMKSINDLLQFTNE